MNISQPLASACAAGCYLVALGGAGSAAAADVEINRAVARVTIIPEARSDMAVTVVRTNSHYPIRVSRDGGGVRVSGDLGWNGGNCHGSEGRVWVSVWGRPDAHFEDMPQIVIRTPRVVTVRADGAVYGLVGPGQTLELGNAGCGDWKVADQTGDLTVKSAGSGDVRGGTAGAVRVRSAGSGDVTLKGARGGLDAQVVGSGNITLGVVAGAMRARVMGSGDVLVHGGSVDAMTASVAGSGDIRFGGVARSLEAQIAGSGDISAARVIGPVVKHVAGSGDVRVGG
jgi:hypothetical protein